MFRHSTLPLVTKPHLKRRNSLHYFGWWQLNTHAYNYFYRIHLLAPHSYRCCQPLHLHPLILQIILFCILHFDTLFVFSLSLFCVGAWIAAAGFVRAVAELYAWKIFLSQPQEPTSVFHSLPLTLHSQWISSHGYGGPRSAQAITWAGTPSAISYPHWMISTNSSDGLPLSTARSRNWPTACAGTGLLMLEAGL